MSVWLDIARLLAGDYIQSLEDKVKSLELKIKALELRCETQGEFILELLEVVE